jgi:hypothetical protein
MERGHELRRPENSPQADGGFRRDAFGDRGHGRDAVRQPDGIRRLGRAHGAAYLSLRAADTAAFRLTRQENSLRGFLLSGDEYYVKRLEEAHKPKFLAALDELRTLAKGDEAELARIAAVDAAYANYRKKAIEPGESLGRDPATRPAGRRPGQARRRRRPGGLGRSRTPSSDRQGRRSRRRHRGRRPEEVRRWKPA